MPAQPITMQNGREGREQPLTLNRKHHRHHQQAHKDKPLRLNEVESGFHAQRK